MTTTEEALNILKQYADNIIPKTSASSLYIKPNIPGKKLKNALEKYGARIRQDEVIALLDTTFFGSARDGALITSYNIACKPTFFPAITIWYDEIYAMGVIKHPEFKHLDRVGVKLKNGEEKEFPELDFNPEVLKDFLADMIFFSESKNNFSRNSGNKFDADFNNNKKVNLDYE